MPEAVSSNNSRETAPTATWGAVSHGAAVHGRVVTSRRARCGATALVDESDPSNKSQVSSLKSEVSGLAL